jgi:hypothetical protein
MQRRSHQRTMPRLVSQITHPSPCQICDLDLPPNRRSSHKKGSIVQPHLCIVRIFIHSSIWPGQTWDVSLSGWIDWYQNTPQSVHPTITYVQYTPISTDAWRTPLIHSSPLLVAILRCPLSTHKWTLIGTHDAPGCSTKLWYPLYLRLHPKK